MKDNSEGRVRVVIEAVQPEVGGGRFAIKRIAGDEVVVEADIFADGHDSLAAVLLYRREGEPAWTETPMEFLVNDLWRGSFTVTQVGYYSYTVEAWVDQFQTWRKDMLKRVEAAQTNLPVYLRAGAELVQEASRRASGENRRKLGEWADTLASGQLALEERVGIALSKTLAEMMDKYPDRRFAATYDIEQKVWVDREKARFSTWYEMFPRSASPVAGQHGTFKDCEARLPYVAGMGFDVLYFPPIHPIGATNRKGRNNAVTASPEDPGTPWAIGSGEGGFKSIHPALGTLGDFHNLLKKAAGYGIEIALDIAFQCSPDHPYVKEHPEWFLWRPDGTVQFAENPPKKYQDIYPLNFETASWKELWDELKSVILFWIEQGIRIFRVDNPHTKPFRFWEWLISGVKKDYPDVIFLSEAFTRPKVMYRLAKLGFTQSYTYFTWRNSKWELTEYFTELTQTRVREFFRPNLWPNTPDILHEYLQSGGKPAFMTRLVLTATLGTSYGIYGPAFELCLNKPREPGSEEYLNSEKYELKSWGIEDPDSLRDFISRVNRIRRENHALQKNVNLRFHKLDNGQLLCYSKHSPDFSNVILVVVNLDYRYRQSGWVELPLADLRLNGNEPYKVHDLLSDVTYTWQGARNYVALDPAICPAHVFRINQDAARSKDIYQPGL